MSCLWPCFFSYLFLSSDAYLPLCRKLKLAAFSELLWASLESRRLLHFLVAFQSPPSTHQGFHKGVLDLWTLVRTDV